MIKQLLCLPIFLFLLSCESKTPIKTLTACNEELRICNEDTNKSICNKKDCLQGMLNEKWFEKDIAKFDESATKCQEQYDNCLKSIN